MGSLHLFCSFICVFGICLVNSEMFTAVVDLEKLLKTEAEIVKTLENYINAEESRLQKIRSLREEYGKIYEAASEDTTSFLANPVNAYLLVKKLTSDWKAAESLLLGGIGKGEDVSCLNYNIFNNVSFIFKEIIENMTRNRQDIRFPDDEDLNGAAIALLRLQDTYKLETSALAQGKIKGTKQSPELTAGDCFELGRQSYNNGDHYHTVLWMQEALDRVAEEKNKTADKAEILEYLAFSTYMVAKNNV